MSDDLDTLAVADAMAPLYPRDVALERARNLVAGLRYPPEKLATVWAEARGCVALRADLARWDASLDDVTARALWAFAEVRSPSHIAAFALLNRYGVPRPVMRRLGMTERDCG